MNEPSRPSPPPLRRDRSYSPRSTKSSSSYSRSRSRSISPYRRPYRRRYYSRSPPPPLRHRPLLRRYRSRSPPPRRRVNKDCRVYVSNLAFDVTWHQLKDFMREGLDSLFVMNNSFFLK